MNLKAIQQKANEMLGKEILDNFQQFVQQIVSHSDPIHIEFTDKRGDIIQFIRYTKKEE